MVHDLRFLDFEYSEDDAGNGLFDAMASVWPEQLAALHAEIEAVLGWAHRHFGSVHGPLDEGGDWDVDLGGLTETSTPQALAFDPSTQRLTATPGLPGRPRHSITLSIGATPAFCAAFREEFGLDAD